MVSRETSISSGLRQLGLDGASASMLAKFADLVENRAIPIGLLGPAEPGRLIPRHILQSAALAGFVSGAATIVDVGPGAGLPGIPLCIVTLARTTLIESAARAAAFLRDVVRIFDIPAEVVQQPAESAARAGHRERFEAAVSRAVGSPDVVLELTLPLVRVGGRAVLLVGETFEETDDAAVAAAGALGGAQPVYFPIEVPGAEPRTWVMIVDKVNPTAERYPRRPGVPRRRPLGGGVTGVN